MYTAQIEQDIARQIRFKMTETEQVIADMLTENTGRHMLDSGGSAGRHWQRNQGRQFLQEPRGTVDRDYFTVSLFHWLSSRAEYDARLDKHWEEFCDKPENEGETWFELVPKYIEHIQAVCKRNNLDVGGIYGDGDPVCVYTYNEDSLLDQDIHFWYAEIEGVEYALISIHGGCDARGGFTRPRVFEVQGNSELALFDYRQGTIYCTGADCGAAWDSIDGQGLERVEDTGEDGEFEFPEKYDSETPGYRACPVCGAKMEADFF